MNVLERLPPVEQELMGKSWQELAAIAKHYAHQYETLVNHGEIHDLPWEEQEQAHSLYDRVKTIMWHARIIRAKQILDAPNAPPEDIQFAKHIVWEYQIYKLIDGAIPTDPQERAIIIKQDGKPEPEPKFISIKEAYENHRSITHWEYEKIINHILSEHPDTDGKIWTYKEMDVTDGID